MKQIILFNFIIVYTNLLTLMEIIINVINSLNI